MLNIHLILAFAAFLAYETSHAQALTAQKNPQFQTCEISQSTDESGVTLSNSVCMTSIVKDGSRDVEVCEISETVTADNGLYSSRKCYFGMLQQGFERVSDSKSSSRAASDSVKYAQKSYAQSIGNSLQNVQSSQKIDQMTSSKGLSDRNSFEK